MLLSISLLFGGLSYIVWYVRCFVKGGKCPCVLCRFGRHYKRETEKIELTLAVLLGIVLLLAAFLYYRELIVFVVLLLLSAFINYSQNRFRLPFDISPSLVLLILISIKWGFIAGLVFLLLGSTIPSVLVAGFNHMTLLFTFIAAFVGYVSALAISPNLYLYGLSMIGLQSVLAFIVVKLLSNNVRTLFAVSFGFLLNSVYLYLLQGIFI